jgi:hypothetical protein
MSLWLALGYAHRILDHPNVMVVSPGICTLNTGLTQCLRDYPWDKHLNDWIIPMLWWLTLGYAHRILD